MDNYIDAYDEKEWSLLTPPVMKDEASADTQSSYSEIKENTKKKNRVSSPVLTIQLVICLLLLIFLFLAKTFAVDTFDKIKLWYDTELSASLFFSGDFSELDYSQILGSTEDEL